MINKNRTTQRHITVEPYNVKWKAAFLDIKSELVNALGELAVSVEHVGSTSVEGLWAKPIIDVDVVIQNNQTFDAVVSALATIGYIHIGDLGIVGREAFGYSGKTHLMAHHLYVCTKDSKELHRHLSFRDYLRCHPEAVIKYSKAKCEAAAKFPYDIDGYMNCKSPCIEELYKQCGLSD